MRAPWRPSLIAQTISDWPRRASPAANTPVDEVVVRRRPATLPRASMLDAELVEQLLLGMQEAHREQHEVGLRSRARCPRRARTAAPLGLRVVQGRHAPVLAEKRVVVTRESCSPTAERPGLLHRVGEAVLLRPQRPRRAVVGPVVGRLGQQLELHDRRGALADRVPDAVGAGVAAADDDDVLAGGGDLRGVARRVSRRRPALRAYR